jgi:hypothetical protein
MEKIKVIELIIDEDNEISGIDAISIVDDPAIQEDFIALSSQEIKLAEVDKEKRILLGPALIPNKKIYRKHKEEEYFIYFSKDTVRKASELFLAKGRQNNATLEHDEKLKGLSVVESWIIEDSNQDKAKKYGFDLPNGTWMVSMKVYDELVWQEYVKTGKVKGFSIEGHFADSMERPPEQLPETADESLEILEELADMLDTELESYSDYPDGVKNNAKRVLEYVKKNGWGSCGTPVGKARASQLASGENLSVNTIKRMRNFLIRHAKDLEVSTSYGDGCGKLMYDAWGGKAGLRWATSKLKELGEIELESMVISDDMAIIDDRLAYSQKDRKALQKKADDFNERYKKKLGYGITVGMLASVFQRGLGAFNTSHSPRVRSASQWAHARVNAFMYLVKNGRPQNKKYTTDYDLLPKKHPKSSKK